MQKLRVVLEVIIICSFLYCIPQARAYEVKHAGAMKTIMRKGDISATFDLSELKEKKGVYALGALEELQGEIQIFDGVPYISYGSHGKLVIDNSFSRKATLLVYTEVSAWNEIKIPASITTQEQFEKYVAHVASENGIDTEKPFPFLITGAASSITWHVVNWDKNDTHHTHQKHRTCGPHGTLENANVLILGFYSSKHKGIFTHHSTNMHMHFKTVDNTVAGHIDQLVPGNNMYLKLPAKD
jgi:alpha-acetolactate decarboxylase